MLWLNHLKADRVILDNFVRHLDEQIQQHMQSAALDAKGWEAVVEERGAIRALRALRVQATAEENENVSKERYRRAASSR